MTPKLTGKRCLCNACGNTFSTLSNFDKHRKGRHGVNRHCVAPGNVGLVMSPIGVWQGPPRIMAGEE